MTYLREIFDINKGRKETETFDNKSLRYIQIDDLRSNNNIKYCLGNKQNVRCNTDDILIAWDGANAGTIGYGLEGTIGSTLAKLTPKRKDLFIPYIGKFLQSKSKFLRKRCTGATIPHINRFELERISIPLPPLETQRKISAILDKADALVQNDRKILAKYDALARSVFLEMFGDPVRNNKGWEIVNLKELSTILRDGPFGSNLKTEHYIEQGIRVIRLQNIGINEFINNDKAYVSHQHYETIKKHTCIPGDVLVATLGEPNIRACKFPLFLERAINKADCVQIRPKMEHLNADYLTYLLNSHAILFWIGTMLHGQTRTRVSMGQISTLNIPTPPLALQNRFSEIIINIEAQKQSARQSLQKSEELFWSLVQGVFGEEYSK